MQQPSADLGESKEIASPKTAHRTKHLPALDGLRAIALVSVLLHHYLPPLFAAGTPFRNAAHWALAMGGMGVDLFFALSGFLITGILIDAKGASASSFFGRFYKRRSLRIFPAYFAFLVPLLFLPVLFQNLSRWWFVLYLRNWLGPDNYSDSTLGHLWSLAVEEQFYILWAPLVYLCPKKFLPALILLLSAAALLFRWWMYVNGGLVYDIIRFTNTRMDALLLGGLVAFAWRFWDWRFVKRACLVIALAAFLGFVFNMALDDRLMRIGYYSWTAVFFAALVALCLDLTPASPLGVILGSQLLTHIAKYSYAMYLWHLLGFRLVNRVFLGVLGPFVLPGHAITKIAFVSVAIAAVYAIARISWASIEAPFLRLKDRTAKS